MSDIGESLKLDGYLSKEEENDFVKLAINTIFFILPKNTDSIYCFTYGTAHNLVKNVQDPNFSSKFSNGLMQTLNYLKKRYFSGVHRETSEKYRFPTQPNVFELSNLVTHIESRITEENPLLEEHTELRLQNNLPTKVHVSRTGIKFRKAISLKDRVTIIEYLDENLKNVDAVSSVFGHVQEVDKETSAELQNHLIEKIVEDMITKVKDNSFDFVFKNVEQHAKGENFSFGKRDNDKRDEISSYEDAISKLKAYLKVRPYFGLKELLILETGKEKPKRFLDCIPGVKKHTSLENVIECIMQDTDKENVDNLAKFTFLPPEGNGNYSYYLYHEDEKKVEANNISSYVEAIVALRVFQSSYKETLAKKLGSLKCSFTSRDNPGKKYQDLFINFVNGDIVTRSSQVFAKIGGKWYTFNQDFKGCLINDYTRLISDKFKEQPDDAHFGISWPQSIRENKYNQRFSGKEGYNVGDTIFVDNIELFDIMKTCEDKIFLFHVKAGFGQSTQVACSQIRASAFCIRASINAGSGSDRSYLSRYFDNVITYPGTAPFKQVEKENFNKIGKEKFLNSFQKNKIVFVYAFRKDVTSKNSKTKTTESKPAEKKLKDYKDLPELFSRSSSAMMDLICTNQFLIERGFEFAISQVESQEIKTEEG